MTNTRDIGTEFYRALQSAQNYIDRELSQHGLKARIAVFINYGKDVQIQMECSAYPTTSVKVEGKNIAEMTEEFIRRSGFQRQQDTLQIGPPVVEHQEIEPTGAAQDDDVNVPPRIITGDATLDDDEIPF